MFTFPFEILYESFVKQCYLTLRGIIKKMFSSWYSLQFPSWHMEHKDTALADSNIKNNTIIWENMSKKLINNKGVSRCMPVCVCIKKGMTWVTWTVKCKKCRKKACKWGHLPFSISLVWDESSKLDRVCHQRPLFYTMSKSYIHGFNTVQRYLYNGVLYNGGHLF